MCQITGKALVAAAGIKAEHRLCRQAFPITDISLSPVIALLVNSRDASE